MKLFTPPCAFAAAAFLVSVVVGGCGQRADTFSQPSTATRAANVDPEESFETIVGIFRRAVQDVPIGFVVQEAGGHTMMTGQNTVTHELIRPTKAGEPYQGIITVVSESRYSIQRPVEENDEESTEEPAGSPPSSKSADGVQVFDSSLVGAPDAEGQDTQAATKQAEPGRVTVSRKVDTQQRQYKLVYENGRWVLATKLDPKTEKSIEYAFDRALESQS